MTRVKQTQLLLFAGAVVLSVLLYFAPKKTDKLPEKEAKMGPSKNFESIESFVKTAIAGLPAPEKQVHDQFLKTESYDSLVKFWDKAKRPDLASYYFERTAVKSKKAADWFKAGDRYYYSIRFVQNNNEVPALYEGASRCYEEGLKLDPSNTDARIMLASCYVEGSDDPMKGITILREIEKTDSNNVKLQLSLGLFASKSQQWEKAAKRFEKVIQVDPAYVEAYLHLADAFEQMGKTDKTIEALEKYVANTNDPLAKEEINKYIQQLKQNSSN